MRTTNQRSRDRYWRVKLGLYSTRLDLPPLHELAAAMVKANVLLARNSTDEKAVREAVGEFVTSAISRILRNS
jgi:hypothetical protein